jgi:hypothetical protein
MNYENKNRPAVITDQGGLYSLNDHFSPLFNHHRNSISQL